MTAKRKLTIGMAHHTDYDGVYFTIQSLKLHHLYAEYHNRLDDFELLVVDNSPGNNHGKHVRGLMEGWTKLFNGRYIPFAETTGTTATRQKVFDEAQGEIVICVDCHVLFVPGAITAILDYFEQNPNSKDIVSGPLIYDGIIGIPSTHFDMVWGDDRMLGKWASAWGFKEGVGGFSVRNKNGTTQYVDIMTGNEIYACPNTNEPLPPMGYNGHQQRLVKEGYHVKATQAEPFEIPGMGLGMFAMRKDAWVGFPQHCNGFGGEEMCLHEKVRRNGGKAMCIPLAKWNHRFTRANGTPYPGTEFQKLRNYVLWRNDLPGFEPLNHLEKMFVQSGQVGRADWAALETDPVRATDSASMVRDVETRKLQSPFGLPALGLDVDQIYNWTAETPRDLNEHMPKLRELAGMCNHVTEITKRRESTVALVAGQPGTVISYQLENDPLLILLKEAMRVRIQEPGTTLTQHFGQDTLSYEIAETDMLFIDSHHNADRVKAELNQHAGKVRRFLVFHDTYTYGRRGDNGGEGMLAGLRDWNQDNPEWFIVYHTRVQHGLTVLGRQPQDKPEKIQAVWPPGWGVGTEVKKVLATLNIKAEPGCACNERADMMDLMGIKWCEENMDSFDINGVREREVDFYPDPKGQPTWVVRISGGIIGWLEQETYRRPITRGLPVKRAAIKAVLRQSIRKAKSEEKRRKKSK